jgi:predicted ribosome quality control (RQC) complex YloA/Tae2 family protein
MLILFTIFYIFSTDLILASDEINVKEITMSDSSELGLSTLAELKKSLHTHLQKSTKKLERQKEELADSQKHTWFTQIGDSLMAASANIQRRGNQSITLLNVHTQLQEEVTLNPKLDIKENAELFFKKGKKGKRGAEISEKKVEATRAEIETLRILQSKAEELLRQKEGADPVEIETLISDIKNVIGETKNQNQGDRQKKNEPSVPYRHYTLDDWDIFIGKTDTQNDELSIHFAKPSDIWLHVAGHAGSHVVIRRPKNTGLPPKDVLEKAAMMAVWFSKAKHTSYSEVHYTEARYVRKRRHAPAGEVMIDRHKSIRVSPKSPQDIFPSSFLSDE